MRYLLDTHVILWLISDDPRLGNDQREKLLRADELLWSVASMWEIGIKLSLDRADFRLGPGWARHIPEEMSRNGIKRIDLTPHHCDEITRLPWHHRDPFDRLLIAQANLEHCSIFTVDSQIGRYDVDRTW